MFTKNCWFSIQELFFSVATDSNRIFSTLKKKKKKKKRKKIRRREIKEKKEVEEEKDFYTNKNEKTHLETKSGSTFSSPLQSACDVVYVTVL